MIPAYICTGDEHAYLSILQDAGHRVESMKLPPERKLPLYSTRKGWGNRNQPCYHKGFAGTTHVAGSSFANALLTNLEEERRGGCSLGSSLAKGTELSAPSRGQGLRTPFPRGDAVAAMGTAAQSSQPAWLHSPIGGSGHRKGTCRCPPYVALPWIRSWLEGAEHVVR